MFTAASLCSAALKMSRSEAEERLLEDAAPSTAGDDERSRDFRYIRRMAREEARQVRRRVKRVLLFELTTSCSPPKRFPWRSALCSALA